MTEPVVARFPRWGASAEDYTTLPDRVTMEETVILQPADSIVAAAPVAATGDGSDAGE